MNFATNQANSGLAAADNMPGSGHLLSADSITGDEVCNMQDEKLGKIQDIMFDVNDGTIRYAVLSSGGFLGMGDRLFAVPWKAFTLDAHNKRFLLDVDADRIKNAPGFDKDNWPNMADPSWNSTVESYYAR